MDCACNTTNQHPLPRKLFLSDHITSSSVKEIVDQILAINVEDDGKEETFREYSRPPIFLYINSYGGSVYDGLALVDIIQESVTPIATIAVGACMSMGLWIWLSGGVRLIGKNATLMFHEIGMGINDKVHAIEMEINELKRLQKLENKLITSTSNVTQEMIDSHIQSRDEWYISPKEAIKLKLAHEYYQRGI